MDGFEFLRRLRALPGGRTVPVLALTGYGQVEDIRRVAREGFLGHLTKPLDIPALLQILRSLAPRHANGAPVEPARPAPAPNGA